MTTLNFTIDGIESVKVHLYVWVDNLPGYTYVDCLVPITITPQSLYYIGGQCIGDKSRALENAPIIIKDEYYEWYNLSLNEQRLVTVYSVNGTSIQTIVVAYFGEDMFNDRQLKNLVRLTGVDSLWSRDWFDPRTCNIPILERRHAHGITVLGDGPPRVLDVARAAYHDFLQWWVDRQLNRADDITRLYGARPITRRTCDKVSTTTNDVDDKIENCTLVYSGINMINKHCGNCDARVEFLNDGVYILDPLAYEDIGSRKGDALIHYLVKIDYDDPALNVKITDALGQIKPSHEEEIHDHLHDGMSDDELKEIAIAILENKIFTSAHIAPGEDPSNAFMILAFMPYEYRAALLDLCANFYYAEYDTAAPTRSCNGMPCFFSCKIMTRADGVKVIDMYKKMQAAIRTI